jgi:DNA-binding transcriptional ArsR family regulator
MPDSPKAAAPTLPLETLLKCISGSTRWDILRELADGSSLMVSELAKRTGWGADVISKQLAILRKAGIIINPRGRLFEIAPAFLADKTERFLDFGYCLLRMSVAAKGQ